MIQESGRLVIAALISAVLIATTTFVMSERPERAHPDRDDTRLERVVDLQLPTL